MAYNPGVSYQPADMTESASAFGKAIGDMAAKRKTDAQKAKTLRAAMRLYDPENADRYESMGLGDLEAETQAAAIKQAMAQQAQKEKYQNALISNIEADNKRGQEQLELSRQTEARLAREGRQRAGADRRRDFLSWWDKTLQAYNRNNPPTYPEPRKLDVDGNPYLFQPATGQATPIENTGYWRNRNAQEERIQYLYKNLAAVNRAIDEMGSADGQEYGTLSVQRRDLTRRIVEAERQLMGEPVGQSADAPPSTPTPSADAPPSTPTPSADPELDQAKEAIELDRAKRAIARGQNAASVARRYQERTGKPMNRNYP